MSLHSQSRQGKCQCTALCKDATRDLYAHDLFHGLNNISDQHLNQPAKESSQNQNHISVFA